MTTEDNPPSKLDPPQRHHGRDETRRETARYHHFFQQIPVACIVTDAQGVIADANQAAEALLNMSARHLRDRLLLYFAVDRQEFACLLQTLPRDNALVTTSLDLRPRERARCSVTVAIVSERSSDPSHYVWFFHEAPTEAAATVATRPSLTVVRSIS